MDVPFDSNHFRLEDPVDGPSSGFFLFQANDGAVAKQDCLCPLVAADKKGGKLLQERQVADDHKIPRLSRHPFGPRPDIVVRVEPLAHLGRQIQGGRDDPGGLLGSFLPAVIDL